MSELETNIKAGIDQAFALQQQYAIALRKSDWRQRLDALERFERVFKASYTEFYRAAAADFSKSETEVDIGEIMPVVSELKHTRKKLKSWMKPRSVRSTLATFGTSSKILTEPRGVSLIISPWNYPFNLTFIPMIAAIAAAVVGFPLSGVSEGSAFGALFSVALFVFLLLIFRFVSQRVWSKSEG